jgi:hypothetical protein
MELSWRQDFPATAAQAQSRVILLAHLKKDILQHAFGITSAAPNVAVNPMRFSVLFLPPI